MIASIKMHMHLYGESTVGLPVSLKSSKSCALGVGLKVNVTVQRIDANKRQCKR